MIIIIEGIDKAGKSTIVQDLLTQRMKHGEDPIVFKLSQKPKDKSVKEQEKIKIIYTELFEQANRLNNTRLVIFDRAYPSEMVYSQLRGYDAMQDEFWINFDKTLGSKSVNEQNVFLIYCMAPYEKLLERFESEKEEFLKKEEIAEILTRYDIFLGKTYVPYIKVDTTKDRLININTVKELIEKYEHHRS